MSLSRPRPSSKLSATATATRPKVGKAATTVPNLDPPREEPPRVLAGSREKVVPFPGPHAPSLRQKDDAVGDAFDLGEVVAHEDHRQPQSGVEPAGGGFHPAAGGRPPGAR